MSESYELVRPTDEEIQARMAEVGSDYFNTAKVLRLNAAQAAIETIQDIEDVKQFLRDITPSLIGVL